MYKTKNHTEKNIYEWKLWMLSTINPPRNRVQFSGGLSKYLISKAITKRNNNDFDTNQKNGYMRISEIVI